MKMRANMMRAAALVVAMCALAVGLATTTDASIFDPRANDALHISLPLTQLPEPPRRRHDEPGPTCWRVQEGEAFTAEDAAFSFIHPNSAMRRGVTVAHRAQWLVEVRPLTIEQEEPAWI